MELRNEKLLKEVGQLDYQRKLEADKAEKDINRREELLKIEAFDIKKMKIRLK